MSLKIPLDNRTESLSSTHMYITVLATGGFDVITSAPINASDIEFLLSVHLTGTSLFLTLLNHFRQIRRWSRRSSNGSVHLVCPLLCFCLESLSNSVSWHYESCD